MNSEMNTGDPVSFETIGHVGAAAAGSVELGGIELDRVAMERVLMDREGVRQMRHCLHELANVFTGLVIAGDLLSLHLLEGPLEHYTTEICAGGERGCALVRAIRNQLLAVCGETEAAPQAVAEAASEAVDQGRSAARDVAAEGMSGKEEIGSREISQRTSQAQRAVMEAEK
jgi:hypothetical protein